MFARGELLHDRYQVLTVVGGGSQGTVYEARDRILERTVALKCSFHNEELSEEALSNEARLLATLSKHPALPTVYDYFLEAGWHFLVMEFFAGDDLLTALNKRREPFPIDQVLKWAIRLLSALEHMHGGRPPIIHRDIKPQNLKLNHEGEIVLLDFGLAKSLVAGTKVFGFTASYASLEQLIGLQTDARSDLYSLAASLYHLSTNVKPLDAKKRQASLDQNLADPLAAPHEVNKNIPRSISDAILRGLSVASIDRPKSAAEFRALFESNEETVGFKIAPEVSTVIRTAYRPDRKDNTRLSGQNLLGQTEGHVLALAFSANGKWLASGGWDQVIRLWNLKTGSCEILGRCEGPVNSISFSPDCNSLASASKSVEIWDVKTKRVLKRISQVGFCVTFSADGHYLAWSSRAASTLQGIIGIWLLNKNRTEVMGFTPRWVRSLAFSPDSRKLVSGTWDHSTPICLWDVATRKADSLLGHSEYGIDSVAFSRNGDLVASGGKVITLIHLYENKIRTIGKPEEGICSIAFSPDDKFIAAGGKTASIWYVDSGQSRVLLESDDHINAVAYSPDGTTLACGDNLGRILLIRIDES